MQPLRTALYRTGHYRAGTLRMLWDDASADTAASK
eukprot:SAG31_NODE_23737_length_497_cov_1.077889_1_plen_34_part_10